MREERANNKSTNEKLFGEKIRLVGLNSADPSQEMRARVRDSLLVPCHNHNVINCFTTWQLLCCVPPPHSSTSRGVTESAMSLVVCWVLFIGRKTSSVVDEHKQDLFEKFFGQNYPLGIRVINQAQDHRICPDIDPLQKVFWGFIVKQINIPVNKVQ